jgi:hypothetical protein
MKYVTWIDAQLLNIPEKKLLITGAGQQRDRRR